MSCTMSKDSVLFTHTLLLFAVAFFVSTMLPETFSDGVDSCFSCVYKQGFKLKYRLIEDQEKVLYTRNNECEPGSESKDTSLIVENCPNDTENTYACVKLSGTTLDSTVPTIARGCVELSATLGCRPVVSHTLEIQGEPVSIYEAWGCFCNDTSNCNGKSGFDPMPRHKMYRNDSRSTQVQAVHTLLILNYFLAAVFMPLH